MKNRIGTIAKKELARFFGDKRVALTTLLLPGILIYVLYTFMGSALSNMYSVDDAYAFRLSAVNLPASIQSAAEAGGLSFSPIGQDQVDSAKQELEDKELDLCAVFPENFDEAMTAYDSSSGQPAPQVSLYFNSTSSTSSQAYQLVTGLLDGYESALANKFDVNHGGETYDLASQKDTTGTVFASMLPMLLMLFLFSGCMAVAPESIAGEKERGTIATLLVTPMKRSDLAIGKILALALIALLSGISSALGTVLALPKLMGAASDQLNANVYTPADYALLGVVILSSVLLLITLISLVSCFARTIKEAQTAVIPLMIVVMFIGITAMFGDGARTEWFYYLIPLYNSVQCMVGIFSFDIEPALILATVLSNLVYTGLGVFILTKMFNSERIMFSK